MIESGTRMGRVYPKDTQALTALSATRIEIQPEFGLRILVGADLAFSALMAASTSLQRLFPTATVEPRIEGAHQVLQVTFSGAGHDRGVTREVMAKLIELLEPKYLGRADGTLVFLSDPDAGTRHKIGVLLRLHVDGMRQPTDAQTLMGAPGVRQALDLLQYAVAAHLQVEPGELIAIEDQTGFLPTLHATRTAA